MRDVKRGSKEGVEAVGERRQRKAEEGRVPLGVGPREVSPPALLTSTHCMQNCTEEPAGSCPGRRNKFSYSHTPVGFYASFPGAGGVPNIVAPNQCLALVSLACPQTPGSE